MKKKSEIIIKDIPLSRLEPTNPAPFKPHDLAEVRRSMETVEMMEFLVVCKKGEIFLISDGNKRYQIMLEEGHETAPCIVTSHLDIYTASRQVIAVSPGERNKMINKVSEIVPEDKIAAAIGKQTLKPTIDKNLEGKLHEAVKTAFEGRKLSKAALHELKKVTLKRQAEIMKELKQLGKFNLEMIEGKILQSPKSEMITQGKKNPLTINNEKRASMTKHLQEISKQSDMMELQYNTFANDVIKMMIYIRGFLDDKDFKKFIEEKYPDMYKKIREIMERE